MNVRRASADRIEQDFIDEFNDRRVIAILSGFVEFDLVSISVLNDIERADGIIDIFELIEHAALVLR